jgi:hypothetical protein
LTDALVEPILRFFDIFERLVLPIESFDMFMLRRLGIYKWYRLLRVLRWLVAG